MPRPVSPEPVVEDLPEVDSGAVGDFYREVLEAHKFGASSNDVAQMLDDFFVQQGFTTILYR